MKWPRHLAGEFVVGDRPLDLRRRWRDVPNREERRAAEDQDHHHQQEKTAEFRHNHPPSMPGRDLPPSRITALYRGLEHVSTPGTNHTGVFNLQECPETADQPAPPQDEIGERLDRPVVLVGMMGSGKTSVGRRLAQVMGWPFQDADWAIEDAAGTSVSNIFAEIGEAAFRRSERQVIARLMDERHRQVLALGGGSFVAEETRALIKARAISIWLDSDIDTLVRRTGRRDDRPLLHAGEPRTILSRLLDERRPTYAEADIKIDSGRGSLGDVVELTLAALREIAGDEAPS